MSWTAALEPVCNGCSGAVELRIAAREKDIGELRVRRVLPAPERRSVGPFVFVDHVGPASFPPGAGIAVRPHPHIGLATLTYLFEGEILHRDSLGVVQPIRPGAVNLMTAGRGIVHSERAGSDLDRHARLHGVQTWMALPDDREEIEPGFVHVGAGELPSLDVEGVSVRVVCGAAFGVASPVPVHSPTLYLDLLLPAGSRLALPDEHAERAVYVVEGRVRVEREDLPVGVMAVLAPRAGIVAEAGPASRLVMIGGEPVGRRHLWWNFVSSSRERIEQARRDWREGRFAPVPGDPEFIPLPE